MQVDVLKQFCDVVSAMGVQVLHLSFPFSKESVYDFGLRRQLTSDFDYAGELRKMQKYVEPGTLYMIRDSFEECYASLCVPDVLCQNEKEEFLHIGPYLVQPPKELLNGVIEKNEIPISQIKVLREHYNRIPCFVFPDILERVLVTMAGYLFNTPGECKVNRIERYFRKKIVPVSLINEESNRISMSLIEERYRAENELMRAVENGDMEKAVTIKQKLGTASTRWSQRYGELSVRKHYMTVYNTLCRKAVERAAVHPAHIDEISSKISAKIQAATGPKELAEVESELLRKYCLLVRNHSLKGYSIMVQDVINYIDFHLSDNLSLSVLAEHISVSPNYLSSQFKKEQGGTLTEFINNRRIRAALPLLAMTNIPIQEVGERVGIYDENYFSRLFKKIHGDTPKKYRMLMQSKS